MHCLSATPDGGTVLTTARTAMASFAFSVEGGACTLQVQAADYFKATYEFVLRPRQPISLNVDLQKKETVKQSVEVQARYLTIDPEKTGVLIPSRGRISSGCPNR